MTSGEWIGSGPKIAVLMSDEVRRAKLSAGLATRGYGVIEGSASEHGLDASECNSADATIFGWPFDGTNDGGQLIRRQRRRLPRQVLMAVTASSDPSIELASYEAGADYCVVEPYDLQCLYGQLKAGLRRWGWSFQQARMLAGDVTIDVPGRRVWLRNVELTLSSTQFRLLA